MKTIGIIGTIVVVFALGIISIIYQNPETPTFNSSYPSPSLPIVDVSTLGPSSPATSSTPTPIQKNPTFNEISQPDQIRMKEIITGVMQNTIPVTPELNSEVRGIFKKYGATNDDIDNFVSYGPALATVYQAHFYFDALQAVSSGIPVKSNDRLNFETVALSRGLMTAERIKSNDEEMKLIANHQPVTSSDGRQVIFTADNINNTLNNLMEITTRLQHLIE